MCCRLCATVKFNLSIPKRTDAQHVLENLSSSAIKYYLFCLNTVNPYAITIIMSLFGR